MTARFAAHVRALRERGRSTGTARTPIRMRFTWSAVAVAVLFAFAFLAPLFAPHDPTAAQLDLANRAPSAAYPFGTDALGRCILSRVLTGMHTSLEAALLVVVLSVVIGSIVGACAGFIGGAVDAVLMRITDAFMAFPALVLGIAVAGLLGGGLTNAILALVVPGWTRFARLARAQVLALKGRDFVQASLVGGMGRLGIAVKHLIPHALPPLLVTACLDVGASMLNLAGLSFLGLGASPPSPELGAMVNQAAATFQTAPWAVFAPGIAIFAVVVVVNVFADAANDLLESGNSSISNR